MSKVMKEMCKLFNILHLDALVYHPQTDGLVEWFNKIKRILKNVVANDGRDCDYLIP